MFRESTAERLNISLGRTAAPSDPMCLAQVQLGRLAAAQRPTAPDAKGAGELGILDG